MADFSVTVSALRDGATQMEKAATSIPGIQSRIHAVKGNIGLRVANIANVTERLNVISNNLGEERAAIYSMRDGLNTIAFTYNETENRIADNSGVRASITKSKSVSGEEPILLAKAVAPDLAKKDATSKKSSKKTNKKTKWYNKAYSSVSGGAKWVGKKAASGAKWAGKKVASGAKWASKKVANEAINSLGKLTTVSGILSFSVSVGSGNHATKLAMKMAETNIISDIPKLKVPASKWLDKHLGTKYALTTVAEMGDYLIDVLKAPAAWLKVKDGDYCAPVAATYELLDDFFRAAQDGDALLKYWDYRWFGNKESLEAAKEVFEQDGFGDLFNGQVDNVLGAKYHWLRGFEGSFKRFDEILSDEVKIYKGYSAITGFRDVLSDFMDGKEDTGLREVFTNLKEFNLDDGYEKYYEAYGKLIGGTKDLIEKSVTGDGIGGVIEGLGGILRPIDAGYKYIKGLTAVTDLLQ